MSEKKDEKKPDPPKPAVQTDAELSMLNKVNRMVLKLEPPARQRVVAWLYGRHKGE